jgi:hypothetical protein
VEQLAVAFEDVVDDRLAVDGVIRGLADADVVERSSLGQEWIPPGDRQATLQATKATARLARPTKLPGDGAPRRRVRADAWDGAIRTSLGRSKRSLSAQ